MTTEISLEIIIHRAQEKDLKLLQNFLIENKLKPSIQINQGSLYFYAQSGNDVVGTIGAEFNERYALIRAAGVTAAWRKQGIARRLFDTLIDELKERGIVHLYLFSRQAGEFWKKTGFSNCTIPEVIKFLPDTPQVIEFIADNSIWTDVGWYRPI